MKRLIADFNAVSRNGYCWLLKADAEDFYGQRMRQFQFFENETVELDIGEESVFEAVMKYLFIEEEGREGWVAFPMGKKTRVP